MRYDILGYTYTCADISAKRPVFISEADQEYADKHDTTPLTISGWSALAEDIAAADAAVGDQRLVGPRIAKRDARFISPF